MFCSKCGAQLEDGARFCTSCGASVSSEDMPADEATGPAATEWSGGAATVENAPEETTVIDPFAYQPDQGIADSEIPAWQTSQYAAVSPQGAPAQGASYSQQGATAYSQASAPYGQATQQATQYGRAAQPVTAQQFQVAPPQQPYQPQRQSHVLPVVAAVCGTLAVVAIGFAAYTMGRSSGSADTAAAATTEAAITSAETTAATTEQATQITNNTTIIIDGQTHTVPVQSSGYILPESSSRYYSKSELASLSLNDLWIVRNEIYARHGRGFRDEALQDYFNRQSWYTYRYSPDTFDSMSGVLNDYEIANADTIKSIEEERGSSHLQ